MEASSQEMLGREPEMAAIERLLQEGRTGPAMVVLEGESGIGKSNLVRVAVARARQAGIPVLAAAPHRAERELAFAGLGDLLWDLPDAILDELPGPQREALAIALLRRSEAGAPPGPRVVGLATGSVIDRLTAVNGGLLIAIDDVQWLDRSTADVLGFALRRLGVRPVCLLMARRTGATGTLDEQVPDIATERCTVAGLSLGATHALVIAHTGVVLSRPDLLRFHGLTRGNPLHALELGRALRDGTASLAPGSAVPPDLHSLLRARVAHLSSDVRDVLAAAAAAARPTWTGLTAALPDHAVTAAEQVATAADVVASERDVVVFRHPLLAAAAYSGVTVARRRWLHARLAATEADELERARHLALAAEGPDPTVAAVVEAAARRAFERGAPSAAADLCALARSLTPPGRSDADDRLRLSEAEYRFEAGDTAAADALLVSLLETSGDGRTRTQALALQARIRHFAADVAGGVALARAALRSASPDDPLRGSIAEGIAWGLLLMRGDTAEAELHARLAVAIAEADATSGPPIALAEALAVHAMTGMIAGRDASATMARALRSESAMGRVRVLRYPSFAHAWMLTAQDRFAEARDVLDRLRQRAEDAGDDSSIPPLLTHLAAIDLLAGHLADSAARARTAAELAHHSGQLPTRVAALGRLALAQVRLGEEDAGRATAEGALGLAVGSDGPTGDGALVVARGGEYASWALAELAVRRGAPADAIARLAPMAALMRSAGVLEPGEVRFLPVLVDALMAEGRAPDAGWVVEWLEAMAVMSGRASVLAAAAAARGAVHAGDGDLAGAAVHLALATDHAARSALPFEAAWISLRWGRVLRRATRKREAAEVLTSAEAAFRSLGAAAWAAEAARERHAIGGRSASAARSADSWTATERRVAVLVAEGLTNKEIAARLFVSPKAVEATLSRLYLRTGIRSRAALATRLARLTEPSDPAPM